MDIRIRVLQVIEATTGGTKKHVLSLVEAMDKTRFDVSVACPRVRSRTYGDISFVDELERLEQVSVIPVEMRREIDLVSDARALVVLGETIKEGRYHIVHAHSSKAGVVARLAAKWAGGPVVLYTPHGFSFRSAENRFVHRFYVGIERLCGLWTDRIICVSHTEREQALANRIAPADKLVVIENGLDLSALAAPLDLCKKKRDLGLNPDDPTVGTMGRISWDKGVDYFLRAAARVLTTCSEVQFLVVGDGEARDSLERLAAELGVAPRVTFTGFRRDSEELMNLMDLFVLASPQEALPYAVLEAMACGKPVIAIEGTGAQDAVQHGESGLLVPPRSAGALAQAIIMLLQDRDRAHAMGMAGRRAVESRFTLTRMVSRTEELYEALAQGRSVASILPVAR